LIVHYWLSGADPGTQNQAQNGSRCVRVTGCIWKFRQKVKFDAVALMPMTLLLLPGLLCDAALWRHQVAALHNAAEELAALETFAAPGTT
jgi:hypothetical protein